MKTPKNGRGRPPKSLAAKKSESILLRLGPSEKRGFTDAAELAGVPLSVWVRERLRKVARHELEESGRPVAFLEGVDTEHE